MQEIDLKDLESRKKKLFEFRAQNRRRLPRRRPRNPIERELLFQLDKARWDKWIKEGKIEFVNNRHWKIKILQEVSDDF